MKLAFLTLACDIEQAGTKLPETTYPILDSLSKPILKRKLSSLQLEGVVYAAQSHLRFLPDGTRAGFYIGDSAGKFSLTVAAHRVNDMTL